MLKHEQIDELIQVISHLDRDELVRQFHVYPAPFPIDFTDDFLRSQPVEKLRHVLFGLCMHVGRLPECTAMAA